MKNAPLQVPGGGGVRYIDSVVARLILQGFRPETHLDALQQLLRAPATERVIISVAYLNLGGIELVAEDLTVLAERVSVFAGIRNGITSKQGLDRLLKTGVKLFGVDTGAGGVIYHPKLYLGRSANKASLLVGSANLTIGGLNNNIEAGVEITLDLTRPVDQDLQQATEAQFDELPETYPQNVISVTTADGIEDLLASGRLVDEQVTSPTRSMDSGHQLDDDVPRIRLAVQPRSAPVTILAPPAATARERALLVAWEPVWRSKALTERDLGIPTGATTHSTGSINLDKGFLPKTTDHRHYFRDTVFNALEWVSSRKEVEVAVARFQLVVKGVTLGDADLTIAHSTSTTNTSYRQLNAMTRLRWGRMRQHVANRDLLHRSLKLFRNRSDPMQFLIAID